MQKTQAEDVEFTGSLDQELSKLKKQHRTMMLDLKTYKEETTKYLEKQKKLLRVLNKEKEELQQCTMSLTSRIKKTNEKKEIRLLANLMEEDFLIKKYIDHDKIELKKLEHEIALLANYSNKINYPVRVSCWPSTSNSLKLENKLNTLTVQYNQVLSKNNELRETINQLLVGRNKQLKTYAKLSKHYLSKKKKMSDVIDQAIQSFDQREETCLKLHSLKDKSYKERQVIFNEIQELQRYLNHDYKLQKFMQIKGKDRKVDSSEGTVKESKKVECSVSELEELSSILRTISLILEEPNIEALIMKFKKNEEEVFSLFHYVNDLSKEGQLIVQETDILLRSIDELRKCTDLEKQTRKVEIHHRKEHLEEALHQHSDRLNHIKVIRKIFDQLSDKLNVICIEIGMEKETCIDESNIEVVVTELTDRTLEFLKTKNFLEFEKSCAQTKLLEISKATGSRQTIISSPSTSFYNVHVSSDI